ncbi:MAG: flippase-like domain-containing protein [Alphaproteobacteria bacterium]
MLKRWLPWALKFALSGLLIWYLLGKVDVGAAWDQARGVDPAMLVLASCLMVGQVAVGTLRWHIAMRALGTVLRVIDTARFVYIAMFFNLVLPGAVGGDALRMWKGRRAGLSLTQAVNSVMLERVATVLGLVLLVAATEPLLMDRLGDNPAIYVFPALTALGILGTLFLMVLDRLPSRFHRWRLARGLAYLAGDTRRLFLDARHALPILGYSMVGHVNLALVVYVLAIGLSLPVTFVDCVVLVPPVILIMTIPISIAGWGVRESAMVTAFGFIGIADHSALVLSVLFGIAITLGSLPGGLVWLASAERTLLPKA